MKNVLFVCTSNKDRSPALEQYFRDNYPKNAYRSAGVNDYFTNKHKTRRLLADDIEWADLIVFAEGIHFQMAYNKFSSLFKKQVTIALNLGEFRKEDTDDYLNKAEQKIKYLLI